MATNIELPNTSVIEEIETFRKRYYGLKIEIDRQAFSVPCDIDGQKISLGNYLTHSLSNYLVSKGNYQWLKNDQNREDFARATTHLMLAITQTTGAGLIKPNESVLLTKNEELEKENEQLKETEFQLKAEVADLRTENKRLHNLVGDKDGDNTSTLESGE